jgi:hypothetical protein
MVEPLKDTRIAHPNQSTNAHAQAMQTIESQLGRMSIGQQGGQNGGSVQQGYPHGVAGHHHAASMSQRGGVPSLGGGEMPINVAPGYAQARTQSYTGQQQMRNMSNAGMQQQHPGRQHSVPMPEVGIPDIQFSGQNYPSQQQYMPQPAYQTFDAGSQNIRPVQMSPQTRAATVQEDPWGYPVYPVQGLQSRDTRPRPDRRSTVAGHFYPQTYPEYSDSDSDYEEFGAIRRPIIHHRSSLPNTYPPPMVEFPMGTRSMVGNPAMTVGAPMAGPIAGYSHQPQLVQRGAAGNMPITADRFERPYRVSSGYIMGRSPAYPTLSQDISVLRSILQPMNVKFKDLTPEISRSLINILVHKSAYEIDALRHGYREFTGQDLGIMMKTRLAGTDAHLTYGFMGLVLGPANFDLWLSTHENVCRLHT